MNTKVKLLLVAFAFSIFGYVSASAQVRITVLPFQNMDGELKLNLISYKLQDSLLKALKELDPDSKNFYLVPPDSVEQILSEMNLDPTNPQYPSDIWKAVERLHAQLVVSGNFNIQANRFLINGYVYDVNTKLPNLDYQARDIFKSEAKVLEAVKIIVLNIKPALIKN